VYTVRTKVQDTDDAAATKWVPQNRTLVYTVRTKLQDTDDATATKWVPR